MNARALDWDDIQLFLALYRARTMADAARTLGVNTSTASRRLVALEETTESVLFERGRHGLRATPAADALVAAAERVEAGVDDFRRTLDGFEREVRGLVRVACPPDMADVALVPALGPLLEAHPQLRIELVPGERTVDLVRREADIALRLTRPEQGDLVARRVAGLELVVAAAPERVAAWGTVDDLDAIPWIGWADVRTAPPVAWLAKHVTRELALRTDDLRTQLTAAAQGLGAALVPAPSLDAYGLVPVRLSEACEVLVAPRPSGDLWIVTHRTLRDVPRVRVVWDAMTAALEAAL